MANGELDVLSLRNEDRRVYIRAVENLKDTGVGLETATKQYAEALAMLNAVPCWKQFAHTSNRHHKFLNQKV